MEQTLDLISTSEAASLGCYDSHHNDSRTSV
jgi:hypothetical protein